jgi:hypothetical protein
MKTLRSARSRRIATVLGSVSLGIGALAGSEAVASSGRASAPEIALKLEQGQVYLSQQGGPFQALAGAGPAEVARLAAQLKQMAPEGVTVILPEDATLVADGGVSRSLPPAKAKPRKGSQSAR